MSHVRTKVIVGVLVGVALGLIAREVANTIHDLKMMDEGPTDEEDEKNEELEQVDDYLDPKQFPGVVDMTGMEPLMG